MIFANSSRNDARYFFQAIICLFCCGIHPAFAIPPPETLALIGGGIVYPGLLILGLLTVFLRYIWIKTDLYLLWRVHLTKIITVSVLILLFFSPPLFNPWMPNNHPASVPTIKQWQKSGQSMAFVDVRSKKDYEKVHVAGALNFPSGNGLTQFLKSNHDQKVILYCDVGLRTSIFSGINLDRAVASKNLDENRLYYIPGGLNQLMQMGEASPVSLIIQLPKDYGFYLLSKPNFKIKDEIRLVDEDKLSDKQLYFIQSNSSDGSLIQSLVIYSGIVFATLYILRRKELFTSLFNLPAPWSKWKTAIIGMIIAGFAASLNLFNLFIPYDYDLHVLGGNQMANNAYLISIYAFFAITLLIHLIYPINERLSLLRFQVSKQYVPMRYHRIFKLPTWGNLFIVAGLLYLIYKFHYSLSTIFVLSLFLFIPLCVDGLLYYDIRRPIDLWTLLSRGGFKCAPDGESSIQFNTQNEPALATVSKNSSSLGLFSDEQECAIVRKLLLFFQQDIQLHLNKDNKIVALDLLGNDADAKVLSRHILLKHHQLFPGKIDEQRFSATLFQDVFAHPNPLMLDILNARWGKQGGYLKAFNKLGLAVTTDDRMNQQYMGLAHHVYLDRAFEQAIFSAKPLNRWLRKKIVQMKYHLALESILPDYYTVIEPRMQLRLLRLRESLHQSQSTRQLKRVIKRALNTLCSESALWQSYSSLLHQHAFTQLQRKNSSDLSEMMTHAVYSSLSYYELSELQATQPGHLTAFAKTELVRTHIRQLQLQEWQLISLLLAKLGNQLQSPMSLVYLLKEDFDHLPSDPFRLRNLLEYRYSNWQRQNEWPFPETFSLKDMEQPQQEIHSIESQVLRVSGNQKIISGNAVLFNANMNLEQLPKNSILIANNLLPDQVMLCQHINAIILKQGGYLSHTSIIARERNIPMLAQYPIADIKQNDKLMIAGTQVTRLSNQTLKWEFLENSSDVGHKAQRLAIMRQQGFNVPFSIILQPAAIEKICQSSVDTEELQQLLNVLTQQSSSIIVRSSTNLEDSKDQTYAGLFYSESNITTIEQLTSAIQTAWNNVIDRQQNMNDKITLNLILQPYIQGELGGVLFTKSSTSGFMSVEIAHGGAEGVTQGDAIAASLQIDAQGQTFNLIGEENLLHHQAFQVLYHLGQQLEALFDYPQDIEWIFKDQQFYIIQSRDIRIIP